MIVKINTHPIVVSSHTEYHIEWTGKIIDTDPKLENNMPIFLIKSNNGSIELNTIDIETIERVAKNLTNPQGRGGVVSDRAYIYIIEKNNEKTLLGTVTHSIVRDYRQMYDEFEYY